MRTIILEKQGHSGFIDFLKGISILCVIWTHIYFFPSLTLFPLWGEMAVPVFILIQVVNTYRKGIEAVSFPDIKKIFKRIILPAIIVWLILFVINAMWGGVKYADEVFHNWGYGPGCYYPWVYLQFAFILPITAWIIKKIKHFGHVLCFILLISILLEIICSFIHPASWLYAKLFFRYYFLIYLGYEWLEKGIVLSAKSIVLASISAISIVLLWYNDIDLEPFIYTTGWKVHHWICYFYVLYVLVYLLAIIYQSIWFPNKAKLLFEYLGKASYDIFICQMAVFALIYPERLEMISNSVLRYLIYMVITLSLSLFMGSLVYQIRINMKNRYN